MLNLHLSAGGDSLASVLCLGAHSDDIEIGCGGTILKLLQSNPALEVHWVVLSADAVRAEEAEASARAFLGARSEARIVVKGFPESYFPYQGGEIKRYFDQLGGTISPDVVFTHFRDDLHQDHRMVSDLTWNTFRDHLVVEYEIPKYDGDLGRPNAYVVLDAPQCEQKIEHILKFFRTQEGKHWFSADTFWAMLRLRGIEARSPSGFAEAFHCRKLIVA